MLLDRLLSCTADECVATAHIDAANPFADAQGNVPGYVGIEYLVQTVAAFAGLVRHEQGLPPLVGLVLGTRRCRVLQPLLPAGQLIEIRVKRVLLEEPLGVFDGQVRIATQLYVSGQVKAIQPRNEVELQQLLEPLR